MLSSTVQVVAYSAVLSVYLRYDPECLQQDLIGDPHKHRCPLKYFCCAGNVQDFLEFCCLVYIVFIISAHLLT